jgi:2-dehydropantoate 2-reductase
MPRVRTSKVKFNKIFILGAGAIGSVVGGLLSEKNDVTLVGNKAHMDAVNSNGLSISGDVDATFHVHTDTEIRQIPEETLIFLTTKAYDSEEATKKIRRLLKRDTVMLVMQNGLGNEVVVRNAVGSRPEVLRGITRMAAELVKPGKVRYWKGETIIEQGAAAEKIAHIMNESGLKTSVSMNISSEVWSKLVVNSIVNPLTAIFGVKNREIGAQSLSTVRQRILRECVQVGKAEGIAFPEGLEKQVDREILAYDNFSSMCQDMMKRKKTEIDFLNGKIVELGRKHGVSTPVNATLVDFIKFMEESNGFRRKD